MVGEVGEDVLAERQPKETDKMAEQVHESATPLPKWSADFIAEMRAIQPGDDVELFVHSADGGGILLSVKEVLEDRIITSERATAPHVGRAWWVRNGRGVPIGSAEYVTHPFIRPVDDGTSARVAERDRVALIFRLTNMDLSEVPAEKLREAIRALSDERG